MTTEDKAIRKALKKIGMKLAGDGPGWYTRVTITVDGETYSVQVWADEV